MLVTPGVLDLALHGDSGEYIQESNNIIDVVKFAAYDTRSEYFEVLYC